MRQLFCNVSPSWSGTNTYVALTSCEMALQKTVALKLTSNYSIVQEYCPHDTPDYFTITYFCGALELSNRPHMNM